MTLHSYNSTVHGSIHMPPENSWAQHEKVYVSILNKRAEHRVNFSFEIGDLVRLSHAHLSKGGMLLRDFQSL